MSSPHVCTESRFRGETISVNLCPSPRVLSLPWCQSFLYQAQSRPVEEATGASWISSTPVKTVQTSATHQQNNGCLPCGIRVLRWLRSPGRGSLSFLPFSPPSAFTHRASSGGCRRAQQTLLPVWCQGSPGTTVRAEGSQKSPRSPPGCRKTPQRPDSLLSIRVGAFA